MALSTSLIQAYLKRVQFKILESETMNELNWWIVLGVYSVLTYLVSLRGSEGFLLELGGLRLHQLDTKKELNYFLIPLLGKVKGEHHDRCHLLPCTLLTDSGIQPYQWVKMLIEVKQRQGLVSGPAISDEQRQSTQFLEYWSINAWSLGGIVSWAEGFVSISDQK
jgi:hypothetical protein